MCHHQVIFVYNCHTTRYPTPSILLTYVPTYMYLQCRVQQQWHDFDVPIDPRLLCTWRPWTLSIGGQHLCGATIIIIVTITPSLRPGEARHILVFVLVWPVIYYVLNNAFQTITRSHVMLSHCCPLVSVHVLGDFVQSPDECFVTPCVCVYMGRMWSCDI